MRIFPRQTTMQTQRMVAIFCLISLVIGCLAGVLFLYGDGSILSFRRLKAARLADAEVTELIGTTQYQRTPAQSAPLWRAALEQLRFPLANPYGMLTSELLPVTDALPVSPASQGRLLQPIAKWRDTTQKIALGWIPSASAQETIRMIQENPGINVVSPKWLMVWSGTGLLRSNIQPQVVQYAHQHHIKVWPLLDNQFDARLTHELLSDPAHIGSLVQQLETTAKDSGIDGINVDFENVLPEDRDAFTQFIRKLHDALSPLGVNLSVDVTPDIVYLRDDAAFFHAGLAAYCDELVLMAYDEHWGGDPEPGPVADVPWVTQAVEDLLNTGVPANHLILGLPFYTRFWYVHRDGHVSSEAVASGNVEDILQQHGASGRWIPELGVAYAKYAKPDGYMEVWYETDQTLEQKLRLVNDEGLAGVAVWSLSLPNPDAWPSVVDALRQSLS